MRHTGVVAVSLLLLASSAVAQCLYELDAPRYLPFRERTLDTPVGVADLDDDGAADLVTTHAIVYGFHDQVTLPLAYDQYVIAVADVNRDGRPDFVVRSNTELISFVNGGNRGFEMVRTRTVSDTHYAVADFNGDGIPDLTDRFRVFFGDGRGGFMPGGPTGLPHTGYDGTPLTGDFNGDGKIDIAVIDTTSKFDSVPRLYAGDGAGHFTPLRQLPVNTTAIVAADFDGDGVDEVLIRDYQRGIVLTSARRPDIVLLQNDGGLLLDARAADLNGDGAPDIVILHNTDTQILFNDGHGGFPSKSALPFGAGSIAAADVNGDGDGDLVYTRMNGQGMFVASNNGDGTFRVLPRPLPPGGTQLLHGSWSELRRVELGTNPGSIAFGRFTGGRTLEMAVVVYRSGFRVEIRDVLTSALLQIIPIAIDSAEYQLASGDLNGDGADDLVVDAVGTYFGPTLHDVYTRVGGSLSIFTARAGTLRSPKGLFWPVIGDFNGDGRPDLAVQQQLGDLLVMQGDGRGALGPPQGAPWNADPLIPKPLVVADLDGDGRDDIASADGSSVLLAFGAPNGWRIAQYAVEASAVAVVRSRGERIPSLFIAGSSGTAVLRPSCGRNHAVPR